MKSEETFIRIPLSLLKRKDISPATKLVMGYIITRAGIEKTEWKLIQKDVENMTGLSHGTIVNVFKSLNSKGVITLESVVKTNSPYSTKIYKINLSKNDLSKNDTATCQIMTLEEEKKIKEEYTLSINTGFTVQTLDTDCEKSVITSIGSSSFTSMVSSSVSHSNSDSNPFTEAETYLNDFALSHSMVSIPPNSGSGSGSNYNNSVNPSMVSRIDINQNLGDVFTNLYNSMVPVPTNSLFNGSGTVLDVSMGCPAGVLRPGLDHSDRESVLRSDSAFKCPTNDFDHD